MSQVEKWHFRWLDSRIFTDFFRKTGIFSKFFVEKSYISQDFCRKVVFFTKFPSKNRNFLGIVVEKSDFSRNFVNFFRKKFRRFGILLKSGKVNSSILNSTLDSQLSRKSQSTPKECELKLKELKSSTCEGEFPTSGLYPHKNKTMFHAFHECFLQADKLFQEAASSRSPTNRRPSAWSPTPNPPSKFPRLRWKKRKSQHVSFLPS